MDEGWESFNNTQENLCEECGTENVEVVFIRNAGLKMQVCHSCRDKIAKERHGESRSFLSYFTLEHRQVLSEIGITGADNLNTTASKLLKEIERLRKELKAKEVLNASEIGSST